MASACAEGRISSVTTKRGAGTAQLGSRRAAMDVFDSDNNGYVTTEDIKRVARLLGDELDEAAARQMVAYKEAEPPSEQPLNPGAKAGGARTAAAWPR